MKFLPTAKVKLLCSEVCALRTSEVSPNGEVVVDNPSVSVADSSLYTKEPRAGGETPPLRNRGSEE